MDYQQRRKEQAQQTEQAILQAALELARANSFDTVSYTHLTLPTIA